MHTLRIALAALAAALLLPRGAAATTTASAISVTATLTTTSVVQITPITLPNVTSGGSSSTALTVTLPPNDPYTITAGGGSSGSCTARTMSDGAGHLIPYTLYTDPAHTTIWCDGTTPGSALTGIGTGAAQSIPVYIVVGSLGTSPPGSYSDTILVTITY